MSRMNSKRLLSSQLSFTSTTGDGVGNDVTDVGAEVLTSTTTGERLGSTLVGEIVGGAKHLLLGMSRVVPTGQTHPSPLTVTSKVFSQIQLADPSTTVHLPALLQFLLVHGSVGAGAGQLLCLGS